MQVLSYFCWRLFHLPSNLDWNKVVHTWFQTSWFMGMHKEWILNFSDCIWNFGLLPVKHKMIHEMMKCQRSWSLPKRNTASIIWGLQLLLSKEDPSCTSSGSTQKLCGTKHLRVIHSACRAAELQSCNHPLTLCPNVVPICLAFWTTFLHELRL